MTGWQEGSETTDSGGGGGGGGDGGGCGGQEVRIRINIRALYAFIPSTGSLINLDCCLVPSHRGISHNSRGPALSWIFIDTVTSTLTLPWANIESRKYFSVLIISVLTESLIQNMKATIEKD